MLTPERAESLGEGVEAVFEPLYLVGVVNGDKEHRDCCRDEYEEERERKRLQARVKEEGVGGKDDRPSMKQCKREHNERCGEQPDRVRVEGREEAYGGESDEEGECKGGECEEDIARIDGDEGRCCRKSNREGEDVEKDVIDGIFHEKRGKYPLFRDREASGNVGDEACLPEPAVHELPAHEAERPHHGARKQEEDLSKERGHGVGDCVREERESERPEKGEDDDHHREECEPEPPKDRRVDPPLLLHHGKEEVRHQHRPALDRGRRVPGAYPNR